MQDDRTPSIAPDTIAAIFKILSRTLTVPGFQSLDSDARLATLAEAQRLLALDSLISSTQKQHLATCLELLQVQVWVDEQERVAIAQILQLWNAALLPVAPLPSCLALGDFNG